MRQQEEGIVPRPMYDWNKWFRKKRFTLERGTHYRCPSSSFGQQIRNAAHKRGLSISVEENNGVFTVTVMGKLESHVGPQASLWRESP